MVLQVLQAISLYNAVGNAVTSSGRGGNSAESKQRQLSCTRGLETQGDTMESFGLSFTPAGILLNCKKCSFHRTLENATKFHIRVRTRIVKNSSKAMFFVPQLARRPYKNRTPRLFNSDLDSGPAGAEGYHAELAPNSKSSKIDRPYRHTATFGPKNAIVVPGTKRQIWILIWHW